MEMKFNLPDRTSEHLLAYCDQHNLTVEEVFSQLFMEQILEPDIYLRAEEDQEQCNLFHLWFRDEMEDSIAIVQETARQKALTDYRAEVVTSIFTYILDDILTQPKNAVNLFQKFREVSAKHKPKDLNT